jgi:hypothetical protein
MIRDLSPRPGDACLEAGDRPPVPGEAIGVAGRAWWAWALVACVGLSLGSFTSRQALTRYDELNSGWSWDLAYYNQWFWALTKSDGILSVRPMAMYAVEGPSVWKMNYLAPVRFLIAPVYRLRPEPTTLLIVHAFLFWASVPAAFALAREESGSTWAGVLAALLVPMTPLLEPLAANDFRELQLALPFVILALAGVRGRRPWLAGLGIAGMLACRQEFAVMVATLAIVPGREPEDLGVTYRWARFLFFLGLGWTLLFLGYLRITSGPAAPLLYLQQFGGAKAPIGQTLGTSAEFLFVGLGAWGALMWVQPRVGILVFPWVWSLASGRWALRYLGTTEWHHVRYAAPLVAIGLAAGVLGWGNLWRRLEGQDPVLSRGDAAGDGGRPGGPLVRVARPVQLRPEADPTGRGDPTPAVPRPGPARFDGPGRLRGDRAPVEPAQAVRLRTRPQPAAGVPDALPGRPPRLREALEDQAGDHDLARVCDHPQGADDLGLRPRGGALILTTIEQLLLLGLVPIAWLGLWLGWFRRALQRPGTVADFPRGLDQAAVVLDGAGAIRGVASPPFDLYDPWQDVVRLSTRTAEGCDGRSLAAAALEGSHARIGRRFWLFEVARAGVYLGLRLGGAGVVALAIGFVLLSGGSTPLILEALKLLALATLGPLALWPFEAVALPRASRSLPPEHRRTLLVWALARAWFPQSSPRARA